MYDSSNLELGSPQALTHIMDTMRKGRLDIKQNGIPLNIGKKLGAGGTKTVYEANLDDKRFAIAVPNTVDGIERMTQKWKVALQEPAKTKKIRSLGLLANPDYEAMPVDINGVSFTALKMARYEDLPYQIMDGKSLYSSTVNTDLLPTELNENIYEQYMSNIVPDIQVMLENGLRVGVDSINICIVDEKPRIFLSDVGDAEFGAISKENIPSYAKKYIIFALSAFTNGLTENEYRKHKVFFDSDSFDYRSPDNIISKIVGRLNL